MFRASPQADGVIRLPFPPSSLSGHANGAWYGKAGLVKKHRTWAQGATLEARPIVPPIGDIILRVLFVPPNRRGDRTNFANRMKPYYDGIADALRVNDSRFVPHYTYAEPDKPGRVEIRIEVEP